MAEKIKNINRKTAKRAAFNIKMTAVSAYCDLKDVIIYLENNNNFIPAEIIEKVKRAREKCDLIEQYYTPEIETYLENGKTKIIYK